MQMWRLKVSRKVCLCNADFADGDIGKAHVKLKRSFPFEDTYMTRSESSLSNSHKTAFFARDFTSHCELFR